MSESVKCESLSLEKQCLCGMTIAQRCFKGRTFHVRYQVDNLVESIFIVVHV